MPAPTHQHLTPSSGATGLQRCSSTHEDLVSGNQNLTTAGAGLGATHIQLAFHGHHATLTALQKNATVLVDEALRSDLTRLLDHTLENGIGTSRGEHHHATIGPNDMTVGHQCVHHGGIHHHREPARASKLQGHGLACGHGHGALPGQDNPVIAHLWCQQRNVTTQFSLQPAGILHTSTRRTTREVPTSGEKVLVAQVVDGHDQSTHIDLGCGPKDHTLRVAENQLAIGLNATHDLARVGIQNPIECSRLSTWSDELHRLVTTHIEGVPVHDGLVGRLANRHRTVIRLDAGLARDHLPSRGQDSLRAHG